MPDRQQPWNSVGSQVAARIQTFIQAAARLSIGSQVTGTIQTGSLVAARLSLGSQAAAIIQTGNKAAARTQHRQSDSCAILIEIRQQPVPT